MIDSLTHKEPSTNERKENDMEARKETGPERELRAANGETHQRNRMMNEAAQEGKLPPDEIRDVLPQAMLDARRWLLWKSPGGRKVPFYASGTPRSGNLDSDEDRSRLADFDSAAAAFERGGYAGLGFALGPDGEGGCWQGIDLDKIDERPDLEFLAESLPGYTERSPSGRGMHAIGYGREFAALAPNASGVEAYSRGRFFTVTGDGAGSGEIEDLSGYVRDTLRPVHGTEEAEKPPAIDTSPVKGIIGEGGRNADLTKWGGKLRRIGLNEQEIRAALLALTSTRHAPSLPDDEVASVARSVSRYEPDAKEPAEFGKLADLADLATRMPEPPRFIMPGIPEGAATSIFGHGGVGKSFIALHLAVCIALGRDFCGLPTQRRRVLFLSCEDTIRVLHWRLHHICQHLHIMMADLAGKLDLLDAVGADAVLYAPALNGDFFRPAYGALATIIEERKAEVILIDGITHTFGGDELKRVHVTQYANMLAGLAPENGAVIALGHVAKESTKPGQGPNRRSRDDREGGYSGSTAWNNAFRARWYLRPEYEDDGDGGAMRSDRVVLTDMKGNYGAPRGINIAFSWDADALVFIGERDEQAQEATNAVDRDYRERLAIIAAITDSAQRGIFVPAARQGSSNGLNTIRPNPAFPPSIGGDKGSKARFWRHVDALIQEGKLEIREAVRSSGHLRRGIFAVGAPHTAPLNGTNAATPEG